MFRRIRGKTKFLKLPWTTSNAIAIGGLVVWSSGRLIPATSSTTPSTTFGVAAEAVTSASTAYTTNSMILIEVPIENYVLWEADVTATLVVGDCGLYCDLTDSVTVNRGSSTYDIVQIVNFKSTTKADVILNIGIAGCGVIGA